MVCRAMLLSEILRPECIKIPLESKTKQEAISEMIDLLCDQYGIADRQQIKDAVWQREKTRTTGIGHGVAIPHGKSTQCRQLSMAMGRPANAIEFGSIDGKPVDLIILLVSPVDETGPHIQALANISRLLTDERFRASLKRAGSGQEAFDLIAKREAELTSTL